MSFISGNEHSGHYCAPCVETEIEDKEGVCARRAGEIIYLTILHSARKQKVVEEVIEPNAHSVFSTDEAASVKGNLDGRHSQEALRPTETCPQDSEGYYKGRCNRKTSPK